MTTLLPLEAGATIGGHYRIEGLSNTGGFGAVYRGVALSEGNRPCAIKETYDVTPAARRQALMEAAILFTIKSEHLPQVYDAFEEGGRFYLVMQLIEGQNCSQLVKTHGGAFGEQEVLGWLLPVADVLQELHGRNPPVLHRDIKPANIILTPQGQAVLVDFGLTRLYDPGVETQTLARAVSEGFSPLEQYVGQTSPRSDIYALAATMYFLLTAHTTPASVARSMQDQLIPPRQLNAQISPHVESILLKALAVNADDRYVSMQEFARALRAPAFRGYVDPTVSQSRYQMASALTEMTPIPLSPSPMPGLRPVEQMQQPLPSAQPRPVQQQIPYQRPIPRSGKGAAVPSMARRPVQSAGRGARVIPPPAGGSQLATYPPVYAQRPLPNPFNQGCLWGLLQGTLSGLIVLFLHQQESVYLAFGEGFFFYLLAGLCTTRYGGPVRRAAPAGIWAGVISTVVFWIVLPVGLVAQALQRIDASRQRGIVLTFNQALDIVKPPFFSAHPLSGSSQSWNNLLAFLVVGVTCAIGFALLGGSLGAKRRSKRMARRRAERGL